MNILSLVLIIGIDMNADQIHNQILKLLPRGTLWEGLPNYKLLFKPLALGLEYIYNRMMVLITESRPLSAVETLDSWELDWGLPDACTGQLNTIYERQIALWQKMIDNGGQRDVDYIALAARLGYSITIDEPHTLLPGQQLYGLVPDEDLWCYWRVWINSATNQTFMRQEFTTESTIEERIDSSSVFNIECVFNRLKPAHTHIIFEYNL